MIVPVKHFRKEGDRIVCEVCPFECKLREGRRGLCRGRRVIDGVLSAENYGQVVSISLDPIEKKPLYHVLPGSQILSVGPNGCNLTCKWCQNCAISQFEVPTRYISPDELADEMEMAGSVGVAYTYSEPLIWHEYLLDAGHEVHERGGINVLVTNGMFSPNPLKELIPLVDAVNIDLKFIKDELYRKFTSGRLEWVQRSIRSFLEAGVHVELTHLIVTGISDREDHLRDLVLWISELDAEIPLHLSRYFPHHEWNKNSTEASFMEEAYAVSKQYLKNVYVGNINTASGQNSLCDSCGAVLVERNGYLTRIQQLDSSSICHNCGAKQRFFMGSAS